MRSCDRRKCNVVRGKLSFVNRRKIRKEDRKALERIKNFEIIVKLIIFYLERLIFFFRCFVFLINSSSISRKKLEIIFDYRD